MKNNDKIKTFFLICDTYAPLFEEMPKIEAKTAKIAVNKYLISKNSKKKAKFSKDGHIAAQKLAFSIDENKFYRNGKTTCYTTI